MQYLEVSGTPFLYIGRTVLKGWHPTPQLFRATIPIFCHLFAVHFLFITKNKTTNDFQTAIRLNEKRLIQFENNILYFKLVHSMDF
jgi:hypothetical protein